MSKETPEEYEERKRRNAERAEEREQAQYAKQRLISRARSAASMSDLKAAADAIYELRAEFNEAGNAGRDENRQLNDEFYAICSDVFNRRKAESKRKRQEWEQRQKERQEREREFERNRRVKESVISRARAAARNADSRAAAETLKELQKEFFAAGYAGKEHQQSLKDEFSSINDEVFQRRKSDAEKRQRQRSDNKNKKEALISQAASLASSTDWKATSDKMHDLYAEWRQAGSAGKEEDDALWSRFKAARQLFYDNRTKAREKRERDIAASKSKKETLVGEAKRITLNPSNWQSVHGRLQDIRQELHDAGSAGRDNERLRDEFNVITKRFYERWDAQRKAEQAKRQQGKPQGLFSGPASQRELTRSLRRFSGHSEKYQRFMDKLGPTVSSDKPARGGTPRKGLFGEPIGRWNTKKEQREGQSYAQRQHRAFRTAKTHEHHSDFVFFGGDRDQRTTPLGDAIHSLLHSDALQFMRLRGMEVAGQSEDRLDRRYGRNVLLRKLADFYVYDGPNGGAKYTEAAAGFFAQHPDEREQAMMRMAEEKTFVSQGRSQDYAERLKDYYRKT